jgi:hypothetical protein
MIQNARNDLMLRLRQALEASWDGSTSYQSVEEPGNPALGHCYPTARVVQHYFPAMDIIEGKVWTGTREELHFWNALRTGEEWYHIDLTLQQFPPGSIVREFSVFDRDTPDSERTTRRCKVLLERVQRSLGQ